MKHTFHYHYLEEQVSEGYCCTWILAFKACGCFDQFTILSVDNKYEYGVCVCFSHSAITFQIAIAV